MSSPSLCCNSETKLVSFCCHKNSKAGKIGRKVYGAELFLCEPLQLFPPCFVSYHAVRTITGGFDRKGHIYAFVTRHSIIKSGRVMMWVSIFKRLNLWQILAVLIVSSLSSFCLAASITDRKVDLRDSFTLVNTREPDTALRDAPVLCYRLGCEAPQSFDEFLGLPGSGKTFPPLDLPFRPQCVCEEGVVKVASCAPLKFPGSKCQLNATGMQHYKDFRREADEALIPSEGPSSHTLVADAGQRWLPDIKDYFYRFDEIQDGEGRFPLVKSVHLLVDRLRITRDDLGRPIIAVSTPSSSQGHALAIHLTLETYIPKSVSESLSKLYPFAAIAALDSVNSHFTPRNHQLVEGIKIFMPEAAFFQAQKPYQVTVSIDQRGINGLACVMEYTRKLEHVLTLPNYKALDIIMGSLELEYEVWDWESVMSGESVAKSRLKSIPLSIDLSEFFDSTGPFDFYGDSLESLIIRSADNSLCPTQP
jgi:hypothetical protein